MTQALLIGVDLGTSGCKVAAFAEDGRMLSMAREPIATQRPFAGWAEQSPDEWWQAVVGGLRALWRESSIDSAAVAGVGICGHWPSFALFNSASAPLGPAILWSDARGLLLAEHEVASLTARIGLPAGCLSGLPVTKLLWLKVHRPDLFDARNMRWYLGAKDAVVFRLTDMACTDPVEAWWTGVAGRDGKSWDRELLELYGLPTWCWPGIADPTSRAGHVTTESARVTGLRPGTPVAVGTGDGLCNLIGASILEPGQAVAIHGTSLILAAPAPSQLSASIAEAVLLFPPLVEPWRIAYTSTPAGSADAFLQRLLGGQALDEVRQRALAVPTSLDAPLFVPHLDGITSPSVNVDLRGGWLGVSVADDWLVLCRAVSEGMVFSVRQMMEALIEAGVCVDTLTLAGGGARNRALCQLYADILARPVVRLRSPEAGCRGAAVLAGVAARLYPDVKTGMISLADDGDLIEPTPCKDMYDLRYARFCQAVNWLGSWHSLQSG